MSLKPEQIDEIDSDLVNGLLISAVRRYRTFTGADLATAKGFIDQRIEELRVSGNVDSSIFIEKSQPNKVLMASIKPLKRRQLKPIRKALDRLGSHLYGYNYEVLLSAEGASVPDARLPVHEVMLKLYPKSHPFGVETVQVSEDEFKETIADMLAYEGDQGAGPQFDDKRRDGLKQELIPSLFSEIDTLTPLGDSTILAYPSEVGLPGYHVFWFFAFLIHHPVNGSCLVVTGVSSD